MVVVLFAVGGLLAGVFAQQAVDAGIRATGSQVLALGGVVTLPVAIGLVAAVVTFGVLYRHAEASAFLDSVLTELTKVSWPSRDETTQNAFIVVGASAFFAGLLAVYDFGWARITGLFLFTSG
jgi:preprotein translocase SecE subunit